MSGHSHWATTKHKKGIADAKRGKVFSKVGKEITVAARDGGTDSSMNPKLRMVIERAKKVNMPKDNIQRAIDKAGGGSDSANLVEANFEVLKDDISIIITSITDNKNRTLSDIKKILNKFGGKLLAEGTLSWMFKKMSIFSIKGKEKDELEMLAIDAGAEDMEFHDDYLEVYGKVEDYEKIRKFLDDKNIEMENASLGYIANEKKPAPKSTEGLFKLLENLDDNDDVQSLYTNCDL